jgi:hypothetical protein
VAKDKVVTHSPEYVQKLEAICYSLKEYFDGCNIEEMMNRMECDNVSRFVAHRVIDLRMHLGA